MTKGVLLFEIKKKKYHVIEGSLQIKSMIYLKFLFIEGTREYVYRKLIDGIGLSYCV